MSPLSIELAFDSESDLRLGALWSRLSAIYGGPKNSDLGVRPHITLAVFRDGEPVDPSGLVASLAHRLTSFPVDLVALDCFPTTEGVVFLRPAQSASLLSAHAALHKLLGRDSDLVHPYYRSAYWNPHCTVATGVPEPLMVAVLAACHPADVFRQVRIERVQAVRYRPVTKLAAAALEAKPK
jgi:hypothetical protein